MNIIDKSLEFWVGPKNKIKGPECGPQVLSSPHCGSNTIDRMGDFFLGVPEIMNPNTNWSKAVYKQRGGVYVVFEIIHHKGTIYFLSIRYFEGNGFGLYSDTIKKISNHAVGKFNDFLESLQK